MDYKQKYEHETQVEEFSEFNPKKKQKHIIIFIIFAVLVAGALYIISQPKKAPELSPERIAKRDSAIERVIKRNTKKENCEQYVLTARRSGYYPVLYRGIRIAKDSIWLNTGDVWKYGKTCVGEADRYSNLIYYYDGKYLLDNSILRYRKQFVGSEKNCLIEEKKKIYNYPLLPECVTKKRKLLRPPGNKIDN